MSWRFQPKPEDDQVCITCRKKVTPAAELTYIVVNKNGDYCRMCQVCWSQGATVRGSK